MNPNSQEPHTRQPCLTLTLWNAATRCNDVSAGAEVLNLSKDFFFFFLVTQWRSDGAGCETQEVEIGSEIELVLVLYLKLIIFHFPAPVEV